MIAITIIMIIFLILPIPIFSYRNIKVLKFRLNLNHLCYEYSIKNLNQGGQIGWKKFWSKLPSYNKMVFSFKKIRLETYFTKEEIDELMLKPKQSIDKIIIPNAN